MFYSGDDVINIRMNQEISCEYRVFTFHIFYSEKIGAIHKSTQENTDLYAFPGLSPLY